MDAEEVAPEASDESFPELLRDLAVDVARLARQELVLAGAEMERKGRAVARNTVRCAVGAVLAAMSLPVLAGALVLALGSVIPMWMSAAIFAVVLGGAGVGLYWKGRSELHDIRLLPTETFASLRGDRDWAKYQIQTTRDQMSVSMDELRRRISLATKKKRRAPAKRRATKKEITP